MFCGGALPVSSKLGGEIAVGDQEAAAGAEDTSDHSVDLVPVVDVNDAADKEYGIQRRVFDPQILDVTATDQNSIGNSAIPGPLDSDVTLFRAQGDAFRAGQIDYEEYCARDAAHWAGLREETLRAITDHIPYRPGVRESAGLLKQAGCLMGIVSTGLTLLAERARDDLDLAFTMANELVAKDGVLTGQVKVNVQHARKGEAIDLFCGQFGVDHREVITVGDSEGDISMFERSGFSVAFNPSGASTARAATIVHEGESLIDLMLRLPLGLPASP